VTAQAGLERRAIVLERVREGRYEMCIPELLLETDGHALVQFANQLKKLVTDGKGPAIYVIRFDEK
jgi:hypothetical protein